MLLISILGGCGDSDDINMRTDTQGNIRIGNSRAVFNDNVTPLVEGQGFQVLQVTENSIILEGDVPPLQAGDIVIKGDGDLQFSRKVVSVVSQGNQVVITTEAVGIFELYKEADIEETILLGPDFLKSLEPGIAGVEFGEPVQREILGQINGQDGVTVNSWVLPIKFNGAVLSDDSRGSVVVNGEIFVGLGLYTQLQPKFENFVIPTGDFAIAPKVFVAGSLTVVGEGSGDFRKEFLLLDNPFSQTLIGFPGIANVPFLDLGVLETGLGITLDGQFAVVIDGSVQANGTTACSGSVSVEGGVGFRNKQWQQVGEGPKIDYDVTAPSLLGEANLNLSLLQPRVSVNLVDMGEARIEASMIQVNVESRAVTQPSPQFNVVVSRSANLTLVVDFKSPAPAFFPPFRLEYPLLNLPKEVVKTLGVPIPSPSKDAGILVLAASAETVIVQGVESYVPLGRNQERLYVAIPIQFFGAFPLVNFLRPVTWTSSNPGVISLKSFGPFAIGRAVGSGNAQIKADANFDSSPSTLKETVRPATLSQISFVKDGVLSRSLSTGTLSRQVLAQESSDALEISEFQTENLQAVGVYQDGSVADLTYALDWTTSGGHARAFRNGQLDGRLSGTSQLTVTDPTSGMQKTITVNVIPSPVRYMHITPLLPNKAKTTTGVPIQLRAIGRHEDNSVRDITRDSFWLTADSGIATVSEGRVTPVSPGEVEIVAVSPGGHAITSKKVVINDAELTRISIEPQTPPELSVGDTFQFKAFASFADGSSREVTDRVHWSVRSKSSGTISEEGLYQAKSFTENRVSAFWSPKSASTEKFESVGPAYLEFSTQPVDVASGTEFEVVVEVRDNKNQLWTPPANITLDLADGSPNNAQLGGSLTRSTSQGRAIFTGLTVDQVAEDYKLRATLFGVASVDSQAFAALDPGQMGTTIGHLFINNSGRVGGVDGLQVMAVDSSGTLTEETGSPYSTGNTARAVARVGNFVYVANAGTGAGKNSITGFQFDPTDGSLTEINQSADDILGTSNNNILKLASGGGDILFGLAGLDGFFKAFRVDTTNGDLAELDSGNFGGGEFYLGLHYHDVPSSPTDLVFMADAASNKIHVLSMDTDVGFFSPPFNSPFDNLATHNNPSAMATVGTNLFVVNGGSPGPNQAAVTHFTMNETTGDLSNPQALVTGDTPSGIYASGDLLFVGTNGATPEIRVYRVTGAVASEVMGSPFPAGELNPHSFAEVALQSGQSGLYVTTSNQLSAFLLDTATGILTTVMGSPYTGFSNPGDVVR